MSRSATPYYLPVGDEVELFEAAWRCRLPVLLKGPTGCGKTRFIEHVTHRFHGPGDDDAPGLITVACHEDLTGSDLVGRYLIKGDDTVWIDGPLTQAVRGGAVCYLDEIVEARQDTVVVLHPLTDSRRYLPLERKNEVVEAHPDFLLVVSYNPGYQDGLKELKASTRQRFGAIELGYPAPELEREIVAHEAGVEPELARRLVTLGAKTRSLKGHVLSEGASTRLLIHAGRLIARGIAPTLACRMSIVLAVTDDPDTQQALDELVLAAF